MSDLVEPHFDLEKLKNNMLDETFLSAFGEWIKWLVGNMGLGTFSVTGKQSEVDAFVNALAGERRYLASAERYGLTDPMTFQNKMQLQNSINSFESETGLTWPIK